MISTKGFKSKLDAIDEYIRKLKQLSVELDFGVIVLSQINRGNKDNPNMSGFKGCGTIEEHCDSALILQWDMDTMEYTIRVEKQRHGEVGEIKVRFLPEYSRFEDIVEIPKDYVK